MDLASRNSVTVDGVDTVMQGLPYRDSRRVGSDLTMMHTHLDHVADSVHMCVQGA